MTQWSMPWDGIDIGDAAVYAPYDADSWTSMYMDMLSYAGDFGVLRSVNNGLAPSLAGGGTTSPVTIATGAALVGGQYYENTAAVDTVLVPDGVSTRYDRMVIQRVWATKTTRIAKLAGVPGAGVPLALTRIWGDTWEIPICQIVIPIAGAFTLIDERVGREYPNMVEREGGGAGWDAVGTVWYETKGVKQVVGADQWTGAADVSGTNDVVFNHAFSQTPLVLVTGPNNTSPPSNVVIGVSAVSTAGFTWAWVSTDGATTYTELDVTWMAIGDE